MPSYTSYAAPLPAPTHPNPLFELLFLILACCHGYRCAELHHRKLVTFPSLVREDQCIRGARRDSHTPLLSLLSSALLCFLPCLLSSLPLSSPASAVASGAGLRHVRAPLISGSFGMQHLGPRSGKAAGCLSNAYWALMDCFCLKGEIQRRSRCPLICSFSRFLFLSLSFFLLLFSRSPSLPFLLPLWNTPSLFCDFSFLSCSVFNSLLTQPLLCAPHLFSHLQAISLFFVFLSFSPSLPSSSLPSALLSISVLCVGAGRLPRMPGPRCLNELLPSALCLCSCTGTPHTHTGEAPGVRFAASVTPPERHTLRPTMSTKKKNTFLSLSVVQSP